MYWRKLYVPDKRAEVFAKVLAEIPETARVASTDYIHPRFTHYARSYDYSDYLRAVNHYKPGVPDDTDYIVIDTHGRYSRIQRPDQVRDTANIPSNGNCCPTTPTVTSSCSNESGQATATPRHYQP